MNRKLDVFIYIGFCAGQKSIDQNKSQPKQLFLMNKICMLRNS